MSAHRAAILAAVVLASAPAGPRYAVADEPAGPEHAVTDEFGRPITSWMLPPETRPVWGLLDPDRARGSGPTLRNADSLTGNWGGYRDRLSEDYGLALVGNYTSESGNPVGGQRQGVTYTHNIGLSLFADLEKLLGIEETVFLVSASNRAGTSLSARYVGNVYAVQQIFGGETTRLVQLALARAFFHRTLRIVAGRINGLDDFIASPLYCNAQNLAFCGNPLSIPSDVNISSYPNTMWGTRVRDSQPGGRAPVRRRARPGHAVRRVVLKAMPVDPGRRHFGGTKTNMIRSLRRSVVRDRGGRDAEATVDTGAVCPADRERVTRARAHDDPA